MTTRTISAAHLFADLPPVWPEDPLPLIRQILATRPEKLVVLDDDPTGTQTVYDIPVLTCWDVNSLRDEFRRAGSCCYLLTNSRSLPPQQAHRVNVEIAENLAIASRQAAGRYALVSRSDSTLRGHYPVETDALSAAVGPFAATIIAPYFDAGGRYTVRDLHYVADGDRLIPAAETPFAGDAVFGYRHSNLREWVAEKTQGRISATQVHSVSIDMLRTGTFEHGPAQSVATYLLSLPRGSVCIVNACHPRDMELFALGTLLAEQGGVRFLYRTAAQFVAARLGLPPLSLWRPESTSRGTRTGGLLIVGSHVPQTTEQLQQLLQDSSLVAVELSVQQLFDAERHRTIDSVVSRVNETIGSGRDVVVYTSRQLASVGDARDNLQIGQSISAALVEVVRQLKSRPRFLVAKGGITSSDVATRGLNVRRAMVRGQVLPGVPVWELGPETNFPGLMYIVFPGNVGGPESLTQVVQILRS